MHFKTKILKFSILKNFRPLKVSKPESFRAIKLSNSEDFRALKLSNLATASTSKKKREGRKYRLRIAKLVNNMTE